MPKINKPTKIIILFTTLIVAIIFAVMVETYAKQAAGLTDFKIGYATLYGLNFNGGAGLRIAGDA